MVKLYLACQAWYLCCGDHDQSPTPACKSETDIVTVEQVYSPMHEYGFTGGTDTVRDYLDLVSPFEVAFLSLINTKWLHLEWWLCGAERWSTPDNSGPRCNHVRLYNKPFFWISPMSVNAWLPEDFEMILLFRVIRPCWSVITRRAWTGW